MKKASDQSDLEALEELTKLNNELANLQRELSKKNIELENSNNLKNRFLGMAAHDLRNPLGYIHNYIELIEDESDRLSPKQKEYLNIVKKTSMSMVQIVNGLLDYSVIESGYINLQTNSYNIVELVADSVNLHEQFAKKKSIHIDYFSSHPILIAEIDKGKIEQVLSNLLSNAIKYSWQNTNVRVYISDKSDKIQYSVEDEGQGMSEKECSILFRPFQKTSAIATGGESSTGLGLFISKKIIEAHNGRIWVNSTKGKGSVFYCELPKQISSS
jgi:signal transduction histidine kinase